MMGSDRIAGVICLGFSALVKAISEAALVVAFQSGAATGRWNIQPMNATDRWWLALLALGVLLILKSVVAEVRQKKNNAAK